MCCVTLPPTGSACQLSVLKTERLACEDIYTSCPICARCNIFTLHVGSREKTNRTERLNSGNQRNRNLKTVRKGKHYYQDGG